MEQDFNIGDTVYLTQNYCDRFKRGHMCPDTPYEISKINLHISQYFFNFIEGYTTSNGHSISTNSIDYIKTKRINNINKILKDGNV